jgi:hypothetical protein
MKKKPGVDLSLVPSLQNKLLRAVKAKGHKENSPKENENIRQGSQSRYIDRTRRIHVRILFVNILTWTAQLLCRLGYGLKDRGL